MTVPVVVDLLRPAPRSREQISTLLDKLAADYAGAFLVARVDVDTSPALVQAFQVQTLPFVVAVVRGQPVPLVADVVPEAALRQVAGQAARGRGPERRDRPGRRARDAAAQGADAEPAGAGRAGALPPLHQAAYDAIERGRPGRRGRGVRAGRCGRARPTTWRPSAWSTSS